MKLSGFLASLAIACSSSAAVADDIATEWDIFTCTTVQFEVHVERYENGQIWYRALNLKTPGPDFVLTGGVRLTNELESILYSFKNDKYEYVVVNSSAAGNEPSQLLVYNNGKQILKQFCKTTSGSEG